ncbi:hypothetical protein ACH40F_47960 [Streptomyces sp. NPDC020794]|uniref:hypothetical protein n=1 Tax=unclassified Streptomyces TaxID=2593676 RepID=UPI0036EC94B3
MTKGRETDEVDLRNFPFFVQTAAEQLLEQAGFYGSPQALLVGFPIDGGRKPWIVESTGTTSYGSADLSEVPERAKIHYGQREKTYDEAPHVEAWFGEKDREWAEAEAIKEVLDAHVASVGRTFFVSGPARVGGDKIHVALSVDSSALEQVPGLGQLDGQQRFLVTSIVEAIIVELLKQAQRDLYLPGAGLLEANPLGRLPSGASEVWVYAIRLMLRTALVRARHFFGDELDSPLKGFTSLLYEGRPSSGRLIIAPRDHSALALALRFETPIPLSNKRYVRKVLEASGSDFGLLIDGVNVYGLGSVAGASDLSGEEIFDISINKGGSWQLEHAGTVLFSVRDDLPSLPTPTFDLARLHEAIADTLPGAEVETLANLAAAAGQHRHGAMLIISADAEAEAKRLAPQATRTQPFPLDPKLLDQLTNMDGGVLLDPQGRCHAIGVILDGAARENGDPARGSRLNNAVRYLSSGVPPAVVLCYSSDGDITILPEPS